MTDSSPSLHHDVGNRQTQDRFNRKPFAVRLAQTIAHRSSSESFVIGLYGAWGEGKSTVLDYMDEALTADPEVVLIRFNPWLFNSDEAMTSGLIKTISEEVDIQLKAKTEGIRRVVQLMATYGGKLAQLVGSVTANSVIKDVGQSVEGLGVAIGPQEPSLEQLKTTISVELLNLDKRVVVLMDDIDRLTRPEIQRVFRLIKVGADFPTITYVLAFDPDMVASAIGEQYGAGNTADGQRFLEKIVQLPLHLPYLDGISLTEYTYDLLTKTLEETGTSLDSRQLARFQESLRENIMPAIRTPRQAKRYANAAGFAIPILPDDTDPVDVLLVEALRVIFPAMFQLVRDRSESFLSPQSAGGFIRDNPERVKERLLETLEGQDTHAIGIVRDLFPDVGRLLTGFHISSGDEDPRPRGVFRRRYFPRYFQYAIPSDDVSDTAIDRFLKQAIQAPGQADAYLISVAPGKPAFKFMVGLQDVIQAVDTETQSGVVLSLARCRSAFEQNPYITALQNPLPLILGIMVASIESSPVNARLQLITDLIGCLHDTAALQLVDVLERHSYTQNPSPAYIRQNAEFLPSLRELLASRFELQGAALKTSLGEDYMRGLRLIARAHGQAPAQANLTRVLEAGEEAVTDFLAQRAARGGKYYLPDEFNGQSYAMLKEVIDIEALIRIFGPYFPESVEPERPEPELMAAMFGPDENYVSDPHLAAAQIAARIRKIRAEEVETLRLDEPQPPDESDKTWPPSDEQ